MRHTGLSETCALQYLDQFHTVDSAVKAALSGCKTGESDVFTTPATVKKLKTQRYTEDDISTFIELTGETDMVIVASYLRYHINTSIEDAINTYMNDVTNADVVANEDPMHQDVPNKVDEVAQLKLDLQTPEAPSQAAVVAALCRRELPRFLDLTGTNVIDANEYLEQADGDLEDALTAFYCDQDTANLMG